MPRTKTKKIASEAALQKAVIDFWRKKYKGVKSFGNALSGVTFTGMSHMMKMKFISNMKSQGWVDAQPDIYFDAPSPHGYHGLRIELKHGSLKTADYVFNLKPEVRRKDRHHYFRQAQYLSSLNKQGYLAVFMHDFDQVMKLTNWYMGELPADVVTLTSKQVTGGPYIGIDFTEILIPEFH